MECQDIHEMRYETDHWGLDPRIGREIGCENYDRKQEESEIQTRTRVHIDDIGTRDGDDESLQDGKSPLSISLHKERRKSDKIHSRYCDDRRIKHIGIFDALYGFSSFFL